MSVTNRMCASQAEPFFNNTLADTPDLGTALLLVNGQFNATLNITADTWVRLRLGFIASNKWL